jgi:predicted nucleic acid-binding protein
VQTGRTGCRSLATFAALDKDDSALSIQVPQEFYLQPTRPTRPDRLSHQHAVALVDIWRRRFQVQEMTPPAFDTALRIKAQHQLSYWDSAIVVAAPTLGCRTLYSENMGDGRDIDGVEIANPFR